LLSFNKTEVLFTLISAGASIVVFKFAFYFQSLAEAFDLLFSVKLIDLRFSISASVLLQPPPRCWSVQSAALNLPRSSIGYRASGGASDPASDFHRLPHLPAVPAAQLPTLRRLSHPPAVPVAVLRLSSELGLRLNSVSSLGLRFDLPPVEPTIESRLTSKILSPGGASDRLPALIETQLPGCPSIRVPICIGTCFSGCPGGSCPRLAPQAVILRVCQRSNFRLAPYSLAPQLTLRSGSQLAP